MRDDVNVTGDERGTDRAVTTHDFQHAFRQVGGHQLGEPAPRLRTPLARLVHHRIAGGQRCTDQPRRDRNRVVPRRQRHDHPTRLRHHEVGRLPPAVQAATAVHPSQLGVLDQGADPGLDPTPRVIPALAGLPFVQRRELVGGLPDSAGGGVQRGAPLVRRCARPSTCRAARPPQSSFALLPRRHRHSAHDLTGARVQHSDLINQHVGHTRYLPRRTRSKPTTPTA